MRLDVVVHAMGRNSGGTEFDLKGLMPHLEPRINGVPPHPLELACSTGIIFGHSPERGARSGMHAGVHGVPAFA